MDLAVLSQVAQVLGGAAVIVGLVFGIVQIRQFRRQRLDVAALELMRSLQDREFTHAFRLIYALRDDTPASELRALGTEHEDAALALGTRFETMGLLVYRDAVPIELVEQLVGGAVVILWHKLRPWVETGRIEGKHPLLFEWFQWLAERLEARGRPTQVPAYLKYKTWTPPKR